MPRTSPLLPTGRGWYARPPARRPSPTSLAGPASRFRSVAGTVLGSGWTRGGLLAVSVVVAAWSLGRVPEASPRPLLLGLLPWIVGKYLLCPLRWHALSVSGRGRWWHLRAYAESELLGLLTPGHAGADAWRVHRLRETGVCRTAGVAEVGLDRLVGALGLALGVLATGAVLPRRVLVVLVVVTVGVLALGLLVRWRRPLLFARRPLPGARTVALGLLLSLAYQATFAILLFSAVAAVGHQVHPLHLLAVFGAAQVAGVVPGVNGASPRDGALAVGLTTLGLPWTAALGAVALVAVLAWGPALLLGGGSLAARRIGESAGGGRQRVEDFHVDPV